MGGFAALAADDVSEAAPWVGHVAAGAQDEVDVRVEPPQDSLDPGRHHGSVRFHRVAG
jgi:hypothetical protein